MTTQQNNTMAEGLSKIVKDISQMKLQPDADMDFLAALEQDIVNYLKPPTAPQAPGAGGAGAPPMAGPGGAMGQAMGQVMGGGGGMPGGAMMAAGGAPGLGMPNPDEFRRGLGQAAQRGSSRQLVHRMLATNPLNP